MTDTPIIREQKWILIVAECGLMQEIRLSGYLAVALESDHLNEPRIIVDR